MDTARTVEANRDARAARSTERPRPRILLVGPFPPTKGGITTFMLNLIASHLSDEFEFVPFNTSRPPKKNVTENWGYRAALRGGFFRLLFGVAVTLRNLAMFPIVIIGKRIAIVQVQASDYLMFWEGVLYVIMARLLRRKVLLRLGGAFDIFHGTAFPFEQRMLSLSLRPPHYLIAQSKYARDYIKAAGRSGPIVLLPNWALERNIAEAPREPSSVPVCLFVANAEAKRKGVDEVFEAAVRLKARGCPARFHFLAMPRVLIDRLKALDLGSIAGVESFVSQRRVLEAMRESHIFLLPSHAEGFPNSLVEAMAAGMACVVTPVGAVPEMTRDGEAIVIPVGDAGALADAIERITNDPILFRSLARKALRRVRESYVANTALPELAEAYRQ